MFWFNIFDAKSSCSLGVKRELLSFRRRIRLVILVQPVGNRRHASCTTKKICRICSATVFAKSERILAKHGSHLHAHSLEIVAFGKASSRLVSLFKMKLFNPGVGLLLTAGSLVRHAGADDPSAAPTATPVVDISTL